MRLASSLLAVSLSLFAANAAQARTLAEIKKTKELRLCYVVYPGIVAVDDEKCTTNCKFSGPAVDVSHAFLNSLGKGIRPVYKRLEWDEQFHGADGKTDREGTYTPKLLADGTCDFYPTNLTKNEWRLKKMDFAVLFPSRMMVVVNKADKPKYRKPSDLAGKTFAVPKDTSFHTWGQKMNEGEFKATPIQFTFVTAEEAMALVDARKADFTMHDSDGALFATKHTMKSGVVAFPVGDKDELGWGFNKADKDLREAAEKFFEKQRQDDKSELNKIWQKYFGMTLTKFVELVTQIQ